jgi:hypothetical protein
MTRGTWRFVQMRGDPCLFHVSSLDRKVRNHGGVWICSKRPVLSFCRPFAGGFPTSSTLGCLDVQETNVLPSNSTPLLRFWAHALRLDDPSPSATTDRTRLALIYPISVLRDLYCSHGELRLKFCDLPEFWRGVQQVWGPGLRAYHVAQLRDSIVRSSPDSDQVDAHRHYYVLITVA